MALLDHLHTLAAVDAYDPSSYAAELESTLGAASTIAALEERDARLSGALVEIDDASGRIMRLRLERVADDMPPTTRRLFATTIASYAGKLDLLGDRVRATRVAEAVVEAVVAAASTTLALRESLRATVLAFVKDLAVKTIPDADRHARDPQLPDQERMTWSQVRRDLEVLAAEPDRISVAPMATRIAAWEKQLDEPAATPELSIAELIELD